MTAETNATETLSASEQPSSVDSANAADAAAGGIIYWILLLAIPVILLKLLMRFIRKTKNEKAEFKVADMPSPDPEPQPVDNTKQ